MHDRRLTKGVLMPTIDIRIRDILKSGADIIVFSAHPSLLAGSGVSGIVHKAAGPELEAFAKLLGPIAPGKSVITPAFNLPAKYIIHTVCPRYIYGTPEEKNLLAMAYRSALSIKGRASDASSIAFVSLGTGVYRWPLEVAAKIAVAELSKSEFESTMMCVADIKIKEAYDKACRDILYCD
jgi:O-acetyl-ADP-ribose deacetylase (regulator of RNase III)